MDETDGILQRAVVPGSIPLDMIYKENNANPKAKKQAGFASDKDSLYDKFKTTVTGLGSRFDKSSTSLLFWPNPDSMKRVMEDYSFKVPMCGTLRIELALLNQEPIFIRGGYDLSIRFPLIS